MHKVSKATILMVACIAMAAPASASKVEGSTLLKDLQPTGTTDKEHKHQAYDLFFQAEGRQYTCRTDSGKSTNATDFVVGSDIKYLIDGTKAKIKTPQGKQVECKIVRVENTPSAQ
jgi:hypothetical protein